MVLGNEGYSQCESTEELYHQETSGHSCEGLTDNSISPHFYKQNISDWDDALSKHLM